MAGGPYTLFFRDSSCPKHDLSGAVTHGCDHLKRSFDSNLDEENAQQLVLQLEEEIKRKRRNRSIVLSEKKRRIKMRHLFSTLQPLLPVSNTDKVARYCVIEETGKYIQNLQDKTEELQKKKAHLLATRGSLNHHTSSAIDRESISLNVCIDVYSSETVIIGISASRMPRSLCKIYEEVEAHALEIQSSDVYRGDSIVFLYIHATVIVDTDCHYSLQKTQMKPRLNAILQNIY